MKITDYCILFLIILLSFVTIYEFKDKMEFSYSLYGEEVNGIVDNATVEALKSGISSDNSKESFVNLESVFDTFIQTTAYLMTGNNYEELRNRINDKVKIMLVVDKDGYYLHKDGIWKEKVYFSDSIHENHVKEIEICIENEMIEDEYKILFPKNNGEISSQTISDFSLIVVFETRQYVYDGERYSNCILSGAKVKNSH